MQVTGLSGIPIRDFSFEQYVQKRKPRAKQQEAFDHGAAEMRLFALEMEQRTGKTKVMIDAAGYWFETGRIDAMLVIAAPSGVPLDWAKDHLPTELPDSIPRQILVWQARRARLKSFERDAQALLTFLGMAILCVNAEALDTVLFRKYIARFLDARRTFAIADEQTLIMLTPGTKQTKIAHAISRHPNVMAKRIADGTPVGSHGPLDLYAAWKFLDPAILGHDNFTSFKHHYAEWEQHYLPSQDRYFPAIKENADGSKRYCHIDELQRRKAPYSYRCTFKEAFPHVTAPTHTARRFELSDEQRRVYDDLRDQYQAEMHDGRIMIAAQVLVRYTRLQQIASNYLPGQEVAEPCLDCEGQVCQRCDGLGYVLRISEGTVVDPKHDPRLDLLQSILRPGDPTVVWAKFTKDVDKVMALATTLNLTPVRYDGTVSSDDKEANKFAFQEGRAGLIVGNTRAGGRGIKLSRGTTMVYYSNQFGLLPRLQSESRTEDAEKTVGTNIIDLIADDTIDEVILSAFRQQLSVAALIQKDPTRIWI